MESHFCLSVGFVKVRSLKRSDLPDVFEEGVYYEG
jgi:hypothetical protein